MIDRPPSNAAASEPEYTPDKMPSATLVTEAYNLAEGQSEASFLRAVNDLVRMAKANGNLDIIVIDPTPENISAAPLARHFPDIQALHLPGQSYDGQKNTAANLVTTDTLVFLDGDCTPAHDGWLESILAPLAEPAIPAVSGLTLYEDLSVTGVAMTILDFGFLFEPKGAVLGCYVSNNVAFRRSALLAQPIPDHALLRCHCYKHAQLMQRSGAPVRCEPDALVFHELPDIAKERYRRGYDYVAALWADPALPGTPLLSATQAYVDEVIRENTKLAFDRVKKAPHALGLQNHKPADLKAEILRLIKLDEDGIWTALKDGETTGYNQKARAAHQQV